MEFPPKGGREKARWNLPKGGRGERYTPHALNIQAESKMESPQRNGLPPHLEHTRGREDGVFPRARGKGEKPSPRLFSVPSPSSFSHFLIPSGGESWDVGKVRKNPAFFLQFPLCPSRACFLLGFFSRFLGGLSLSPLWERARVKGMKRKSS